MKLLTLLLGHGRRVWTKAAIDPTDPQAAVLSGTINPQNQWEFDAVRLQTGESPDGLRRKMIREGYVPVIDEIFVPDPIAADITMLAVDFLHFAEKKTAAPSQRMIDLFESIPLRPDLVVALRTLREHFNADTTPIHRALESRKQVQAQTILTKSLTGVLSW